MNKESMSKNKGMVLVLVIIVLVVLSILSVSLLSLTLAETNLSLEVKDEINSYAIAKSGLEVVAKMLTDDPDQVTDLITNGTVLSGNLGSGTFEVVLSGSIDTTVELSSVGRVNGNTESLNLKLNVLDNPIDFLGNVIYSNEALDLENLNLEGPLQSGSTILAPADYDQAIVHENQKMTINPFTIPTPFTVETEITVKNGDFLTIDSNNIYYSSSDPLNQNDKSVTVNNGGTLYLGSEGNITNIIMDNFEVKGEVIFLGQVRLFIKNSMVIQTSGSVNLHVKDAAGEETDPNDLFIFLGTPDPSDTVNLFNPDGRFESSAGQAMKGYIIGPASFVQINTDKTFIEGGIICDSFVGKSHPSVTYIPPNDDDFIFEDILIVMQKNKYTDY
ncbi:MULTISPECIES: hypothetical protein [unclassified Fusibacter]|uniref:hypothetical protein n=1 Tax=unclassified Fusibacter TaxID=2624464 RepID=UPI001010ED5E|nr:MULTISPECIES: hypothetical protein [unclassified Fusibacter]MCK8058901.1 hypothetical protein [Fusibacter sp. A2]NPE21975.1 hypothetical protein [Fusibacter sp. A1]RXV61543.1 hypothetical protein DWB64_09030 [Fusibacter sp. A1]